MVLLVLLAAPWAVEAQTDTADATLSTLSVSPRDIHGFAADRDYYEVGVDPGVTRATVTAAASDGGASVSFDPPVDADGNTAGHQVDLSAGRNVVTVTVTSSDQVNTEEYQVTINRGVLSLKGWQAGADLDSLTAAGNDRPYGIWSNGTTMWVADIDGDKIYVYRLSDGERDSSKEFELAPDNNNPRGIWSNGTTMWVAQFNATTIYAYNMSDGERDTSKEFNLVGDNRHSMAIWSDGTTTMWVADSSNKKVYAYNMSDGAQDTTEEFNLAPGHGQPSGIWSDGTTMWVADWSDDKLYAYNMDDGARDSGRDFDTLSTAGNGSPAGIWSDGTNTMWVADWSDDKIYAYNMDDVPFVIAGFEADDYIAFEGYTVEVTVTLSEDPERTVILPLTTTHQGGATSSDYSGVPSSVTFNAGETEQTFVLTAVDDAVAEVGESVKLGFSALPRNVSAEETTIIFKDEFPSVTASFQQGSYEVVEGDSVPASITLSADPERTVEVPLTMLNQDGASSADYTMPASVVFKRGELETSFSFEADSDNVLDDGESVMIGFGVLPEGFEAGSPLNTVVSIDDSSRVTHLQRVNPNGKDNHNTTVAGEFTVTIYFFPDTEGLLEEEVEVTNGSIVDFKNIPRGAGAGHNVWYVDILPDLGASSVTVRVPADVVEGGNQPAEVTYDAVPPLMATLTTSVTEPAVGEFMVTVTFDQDVTLLSDSLEGNILWYFSPTEDITISHGTFRLYTPYQKISDQIWEINVVPDPGVGTTVITLPGRTVATGRDTEVWNLEASLEVAAGKRSVNFEQAAYSAGEGDDVVLTVSLDADPLNTVVIPIDVTPNGGAVVSDDYAALPPSVTFNSGETSKTLTFTAIDDDIDDDGESVTIAIGSPLPEIIALGAITETEVSITDDDEAGVTISETALEIQEGQQATYTVVLDSEPTAHVTVTIGSVAGNVVIDPGPLADAIGPIGALARTDLTLDKPTLTFTAQNWNIPQAVMVTAEQDDDGVDDLETLTHAVSSADTVYDGLSADDLNVTVTDDDTPGLTVTPLVHYVTEGEDATFNIVLDTQPTTDVSVAIIGVNTHTHVFTPQNWNIPFGRIVPSGQDTNTAGVLGAIRIVATGGEYEGLGKRVKIYYRDPDPVMRYSLQGVEPVNEDAGTVRVAVMAETNEDGALRIDYKTRVESREDTALAGSDYAAVNETLVFAKDDFEEFVNDRGQTRYRQTMHFDVSILDDPTPESKESFGLVLIQVQGYQWPVYGVRRIEVPIVDNDTPGVTVAPTVLTVAEGGSDTYDVVLDTQPTGDVKVTIDGFSGTDLTLDKTELTFNTADWNSPQTVAVTAGQDADGADDTATLTLAVASVADADYDGLSVDEVGVTVNDDDRVRVTVSPTSLDMDEGGFDAYTVVLDTQPTAHVTVTIDGVSGTDLMLDKSTLTFTATDWDTVQTVTVTAGQDGDGVDDTATLTHTVTSVDTDYDGLSVLSVNVTVSDDDLIGLRVSESSLTMQEGESDDYTLVLDTQPAADVTVAIQGVSGTDLTLDKSTLTFTVTDWDTSQTVTVTAGQDGDGVEDTATLTHAVNSADADYDGLSAEVHITVADDDYVGVTVTPARLTVDEGDSNNYTLVLGTQPAAEVTVTIGGLARTDLTLDKSTLTFKSMEWDIPQTVVVTAGQDDDGVDDTARLTHTVSSTDTDYDGLTARGLRVTVSDDDEAGLTVTPQELTVDEGDSKNYTVVLDTKPAKRVNVIIGGTFDTDLTLTPTYLTFTLRNWDIPQTVTVTAGQDDDAVDDTVPILHFFLSDDSDYNDLDPVRLDVTVSDSDLLAVSFGEATYTVEESDDSSTTLEKENEVTVTITLDQAPGRTVEIEITAAGQGGATADDYSISPTTVTFGATETSKEITFSVEHDTVDDDGETVKLTFGSPLPDRVSEGTVKESVVSITDDDDPEVTVSFASATYTVDESDDASTTGVTENEVTVTVALSADPERTVVIPIGKANQGGATDDDYSGVPANVVFNAGDTEKTFTLTAEHDTVDDDGESVKLVFGGILPDGVSFGSTYESTVSITDDDDPAVEVSYASAAYTVDESDDAATTGVTENEVVVNVTLSADPERTVVIPIEKANQGSATDADYSGVPANVTFNAGDTEQTFTFTATPDTVDDDGESVKLTFGSPLPDGVSEGSTNAASVVSITDDDDPGVTVAFGSAAYTVGESDDATTTLELENEVTVKVVLSADPERTVTIPIGKANQGTATDDDYSGVPDNVTFQSGQKERTFTLTAEHDTDDDDGETVRLTFGSDLPDGVSEGNTNAASVVTINDDDDPAVKVSFASDTYSVEESDDPATTVDKENEVTVTVKLDQAPEREVEIGIVAEGQGTATDDDYSGVPDSVTFGANDVSKTFTLRAEHDTDDDDGETVRLTFGSDLPDGVSEGTTAASVVSINDDDDPAVKVSFASDTYSVEESDDPATTVDKENEVTVTVKLDQAPEREVEIGIVAEGQGTATDDDYSGVPDSVTFGANDVSKTFTLRAEHDTDDDDGETVRLTFGSDLPDGVSEGTTAASVVTINDDDDPAVKVSFASDTYSVEESDDPATTVDKENEVTVTVKLDQAPEREVEIGIVAEGQGTATADDYSISHDSVTFGANDVSKTFTLRAEHDTEDDDGETVRLTFGSDLPDGVSEGNTNAASVVTINDDDDPAVKVSFASDTYSVREERRPGDHGG